jgi:hypothetical protein
MYLQSPRYFWDDEKSRCTIPDFCGAFGLDAGMVQAGYTMLIHFLLRDFIASVVLVCCKLLLDTSVTRLSVLRYSLVASRI